MLCSNKISNYHKIKFLTCKISYHLSFNSILEARSDVQLDVLAFVLKLSWPSTGSDEQDYWLSITIGLQPGEVHQWQHATFHHGCMKCSCLWLAWSGTYPHDLAKVTSSKIRHWPKKLRQPQKLRWPQKLGFPQNILPSLLPLKSYLKFFWWLLTLKATWQLMSNQIC